ncbi:MAG: T9SS type A sorting domain-containing protein [Bacteroidales bacterium]|nr:T9SS type A sorting domain-containing protein [Bacteroidales bacterium]
MRKQLKTLGLVAVSLFLIEVTAKAQTAIPALGGDVVNANGSLSYTVGQIDVGTAIGQGKGSLYGGVQQTYTVEELRVKTPTKDIDISVYPNPAVDGVFVEIPSTETNLRYELLTNIGRRLKNGSLNDNKQKIDMSIYAASTYVLRIIGKDYERDFKIVKTK